jgi:hypothetical protein
MAESLTELTAVDYLNQKNLTGKLFGDSPNLAAEKITEGNVKVFFRVSDRGNPTASKGLSLVGKE